MCERVRVASARLKKGNIVFALRIRKGDAPHKCRKNKIGLFPRFQILAKLCGLPIVVTCVV